jgi:acyl-CoA reductase-like NAD-dependent aldehyde dehydrogenase
VVLKTAEQSPGCALRLVEALHDWAFRGATVLLFVEVVAWLAAL